MKNNNDNHNDRMGNVLFLFFLLCLGNILDVPKPSQTSFGTCNVTTHSTLKKAIEPPN